MKNLEILSLPPRIFSGYSLDSIVIVLYTDIYI